jgi:general secretion pathway protein K
MEITCTMKLRPLGILRSNQRGIAVLVTLTVATVLIVMTLELNRKVRSAVISAATYRDRTTLHQMAVSGVNAAMVVLIKDKMESEADSLQEDWADPQTMAALMTFIPFEAGTVSVSVTDERAKVQVNALVKYPEGKEFSVPQVTMWERLLELVVPPDYLQAESSPISITNSVKDWLDFGDGDAVTGVTGAESDYYQGLDPAYPCRDGLIPYLDELLMIKGITTEIHSGIDDRPGIARFMTVHGMDRTAENKITFDGRININTAELPVLTALLAAGMPLEQADPALAADLAKTLLDYRQETEDLEFVHDLSDPGWYRNVPGFGDVSINQELITTQSDVFRIESAASMGEVKMTLTAVIQREKDPATGAWGCRLLRWQTK